MNIIWHGQTCFELLITPAKNSQVKIVIDPFPEEIGLRLPKVEANILLTTHNRLVHNNIIKAVSGNPFLISGPGEYEVKGVYIQGIPTRHNEKNSKEEGENTIYTIEAEDLKLCHLGNFNQKELTEEQLEKIGDIDILMIPIGGVSTLSTNEALKIMSQIEPNITIPMCYQIPEQQRRVEMKRQLHRLPKLKLKLEGIDKFLKIMGIKKIEPQNKLTIKKKDISPEEAKVVILKP